MSADVIVAGGGVIGLSCALALAERRLSVIVVSEAAPGEASRAAAGMLAPSVERSSPEPDAVGLAARDRYPSFIEYLRERTGIDVALNRRGILQVALSGKGVKGLKRSMPGTSVWLEREELARIEPALAHALGAVHNPLDGSVDNVALVDALLAAARNSDLITFASGRVVRVENSVDGTEAVLFSGAKLNAAKIVIAAGAWSGQIAVRRGLAGAVTPAKGQLVEFEGTSLSHVTYGPRGYIVPRGSSVIAGSTMELTRFDSSTSPEGIAKVCGAAAEILPRLTGLEPKSAWAGLRPVTPDALPLIGPDPESPALIYACGHGRNGILMAPLTGDLVADLVTGSPLPYDLAQFRPDRF